jgi:serine/threonine-protein kinase ATR
MMEFAASVNRILLRDRQCHQRNLGIMTFAVVCLNENCGLIEWVDEVRGFRPIVQDLIDGMEKGLSGSRLRELLFDGKKMDSCVYEQRYENFVNEILPAYPPVLHLWLIARFRVVSQWFQARLTYTRSVAVWSMVGYVLGLGDRHAENILISQKTGSCLHVDFACLFDKAKGFQFPETVPFRLTQNIVDGMGILKTDGAFMASARLVMEVLRLKKQKILAVLSTFVNDPLSEWRNNKRTSTEVEARMTLKEIEGRLSGVSEDRSAIGSPEYVVKELIARASDLRCLAKMYIGWQPYL